MNTQQKTLAYNKRPVSLETDFFGRNIISPYIISASPHSDGYEQVKQAYTSGWEGPVLKTAMNKEYVHIPDQYMYIHGEETYANCDNISDRNIEEVCRDIERLIKEYPDRLTIGSTGGSITGNDEVDRRTWQENTMRMDECGAYGVEYSLSCPQGGEGAHGSIASQNPVLASKIIDWILEVSNPNVPKLFKLTGAVTSIRDIVLSIKEIFNKYPNKKCGITVANSFPSLSTRNFGQKLDKFVVTGMSGTGVKNISYLSLANISDLGVYISGNGGIMNYLDSVYFMSLGAKSIQMCSILMKYGFDIIEELCSGLSFFLKNQGMSSINDIIGFNIENPIIEFQNLPKKRSKPCIDVDGCIQCGNCANCGYTAISIDSVGYPVVDSSRCVSCSLCSKQCVANAIEMI